MSGQTKKCPMCGEEILAIAKKCKHCEEIIDGSSQLNTKEELASDEIPMWVLPVVIVGAIVAFFIWAANEGSGANTVAQTETYATASVATTYKDPYVAGCEKQADLGSNRQVVLAMGGRDAYVKSCAELARSLTE